MLNTTNIKMGSSTSSVVFNTPSSGMMQRSHPKSFFIRFANGSAMEGWIFNKHGEQSVLKKENYKGYYDILAKIEVLQVLIFGDIQYLCEVVKLEDLKDENT